MIVVIGYMHVEPNEFEQFFDDLEVLATAARKRMGNISFDAAASDAKIGRLLIAERWSNQAALTAHLDATDTVDFVRRWQHRMWGDIRKTTLQTNAELCRGICFFRLLQSRRCAASGWHQLKQPNRERFMRSDPPERRTSGFIQSESGLRRDA